MNLMIYLLVDLKIVLALHPKGSEIEADLKGHLSQGGANSNMGTYQNLKFYGGAKPSRGAKLGKYCT